MIGNPVVPPNFAISIDISFKPLYKMNNTFSLLPADRADHELMELVERIYIDSFPVAERRPFLKFMQLLSENTYFRLYIIRRHHEAVGFITTWNFESFVYVEHFALQADKRGGGTGSFAIQEISRMSPLPVLLEVEPPLEEMAQRRISFYERAGFRLWQQLPYIQPPYEPEGDEVELVLMTKGEIDLESCYEAVVSQIYREVYQAAPERYLKQKTK